MTEPKKKPAKKPRRLRFKATGYVVRRGNQWENADGVLGSAARAFVFPLRPTISEGEKREGYEVEVVRVLGLLSARKNRTRTR